MSNNLTQALLEIQQAAPKLQKDKINPHFGSRYIGLDTLVEAVAPLLNKHGLVWLTLPSRDETGHPALKYRLLHAATGESIEDAIPLMIQKGTPQEQGSAITYARRYALMAVLNLVADEDDDADQTRSAPPSLPAHQTTSGTVEPLEQPTEDQEKVLRGLVAELTKALKADHPEVWKAIVAWAKQRDLNLEEPPPAALRPLERQLRRKLEAVQLEVAKRAEAGTKKAS